MIAVLRDIVGNWFYIWQANSTEEFFNRMLSAGEGPFSVALIIVIILSIAKSQAPKELKNPLNWMMGVTIAGAAIAMCAPIILPMIVLAGGAYALYQLFARQPAQRGSSRRN